MVLGPISRPTPTASQVLIKVYASALNPVDLVRDSFEVTDIFPIVVGYDVAGVVESVGSDVTTLKRGDRVYGDVMRNSNGPKVSGTIAEYCVADADLLSHIPDGFSFTHAAALPVVVFTALQSFDITGCKQGDKVFISGGAGGVGIHAMQVAKAEFGVSQVATTASAAKKEFVQSYGADIIVDYKTQDAGEVLSGWADVVLDTTKETDMGQRILREGGELVTISDFSKPVKTVVLEPSKQFLERTNRMLKNGTLKPVIDTVYPLSKALDAVKHQEGGRSKGKVMIKVQDE